MAATRWILTAGAASTANHYSTSNHLQQTPLPPHYLVFARVSPLSVSFQQVCLRCLMCLSRCRQRHPDLCCGKLSTNRSLPEQLGVGFQHRRSTPCSTLKVFSSSPLCHPREFASIAEGRPQGANSISPTWVHLTCSLCQEDELSGWRRLKSSAIFISG